jgi:hypothetical protein
LKKEMTMIRRVLTAALFVAAAPVFASNVIHSAPTEMGYTEHPEHAQPSKSRAEVLAAIDRSKADGSWVFHRIGAPLPAQAGTLTREQVLADLERAQRHPTWSARRVGAPVSMN